MTQFFTYRAFANTDSDLSFISVTETTGNSLLCSTSDDEGDGYNDVAVTRILKAKNAKTSIAFTDGDEFLNWLHK
jgi:hypothetical protein